MCLACLLVDLIKEEKLGQRAKKVADDVILHGGWGALGCALREHREVLVKSTSKKDLLWSRCLFMKEKLIVIPYLDHRIPDELCREIRMFML